MMAVSIPILLAELLGVVKSRWVGGLLSFWRTGGNAANISTTDARWQALKSPCRVRTAKGTTKTLDAKYHR